MKYSLLTTILVSFISTTAFAQLTPKQIYKKCGAGVVLLLGSDDGRSGSGGTGSIITKQGHIITNAHVVISDATKQPYKTLYAFLKPDKLTGDNRQDLKQRYKLKCSSWSPKEELDLALCQMQEVPEDLPVIGFTDPDTVEIGDPVVAIGHPEQGGLWTLTTGTISTVIANFGRIKGKNVFQTEASVNRGNSGGPLLDQNGNMVGINTMIARKGAGGIAITDINFSLKSSVAVSWLKTIGVAMAYADVQASDTQVAAAIAQESKVVKTPPTKTQQQQTAEVQEQEEQPTIIIKVEEDKTDKTEVSKKMTAPIMPNKKAKEKVVQGKPLDTKKAKPKYITQKRPYNIDDLRKKQMKEMEDLMKEMRGKVKEKKKRGLGLW